MIVLSSFIASFLLFASLFLWPLSAYGLYGTVLSVIDGDTYDVNIAQQRVRIRVLLIDTPELHHPSRGEEELGQEAKEAIEKKILGQVVRVELKGVDRYDRSLGHVWIVESNSEELASVYLCRMGLALPLIMEDDDHIDDVKKAVYWAACHKKGLWRIASRRIFSARQAAYEVTTLKGHFIKLHMEVGKIVETKGAYRVYPKKGRLALYIRKRGWRGTLLSKGDRLCVVGKLCAGYRGPVVEVSSEAQLGTK